MTEETQHTLRGYTEGLRAPIHALSHSTCEFHLVIAIAMFFLRRYVLQTLVLVFFVCFAIWSTTAPLRRQKIDSEPTVVSHDIANTGADIASVVSVARPRHGSSLRLSFLFWLVDLAATPDNLFALDLAAELVALGHVVVVESAAGGELRELRGQSVYRGHRQAEAKFRVKVNPALAEVLKGENVNSKVWKMASASFNGNDPHIILCFSALWQKVGLRLPHDGLRRSRLVWYYYPPLDCRGREKDDVQDMRQISLAMANFDAVFFTSDAAREEWAKDSEKYLTFRPFLRTAEASSRFSTQVSKDRDELRSAHRISLDGFLVTVVANPWCSKREVDLSSPRLVEMMKARFGHDWLIVLYQHEPVQEMQQGLSLPTNLIFVSDWRELLRYIAVADLHVSLSLPDFAFEVIHARSFAVPVLTIRSELAFRHSHDCFILKTVKQTTLEGKLKKIINQPAGVLYQVGEAGRQAVLPGFVGSAVTTRVSHVVDWLNNLLVSRRGTSKRRIGIFVQLQNPTTEFELLWPCILNVLESQGRSSVDVVMTTPQEVSSLQAAVARMKSRREVFYVVASQAEDRGADAGMFFQQLLLSQELSISPPIILKVLWNWRSDWGSHTMKTMCGSVSAVRRMIGSLISDATSGMIGPARLTWNVKNQGDHEALSYFGRSESARLGMMFSWSSMSTSEFPAEKHLWIVTGGCYWVRMDIPWWENFVFPVATRLLVNLGPHDAACVSASCQIVSAMQWLIPSFISSHGNKVASRKPE